MSYDDKAKLACIKRELGLRKSVYPRWVSTGRISQKQAIYEIAVMQAIFEEYQSRVQLEREQLELLELT